MLQFLKKKKKILLTWNLIFNKNLLGLGCGSVIENLPSKHRVLSSNFSITKDKAEVYFRFEGGIIEFLDERKLREFSSADLL
jgi:hypothetical protein